MPQPDSQDSYGGESRSPISAVEDYLLEEDLHVERPAENELTSEITGHWGAYRLWVVYHEESAFLQFNCYLDIKIPERAVDKVSELMFLMNERVWLGHFEIWNEEQTPVFRIVVPLRGSQISDEQLEDMMSALYHESERFYPAIQWVIWGGKTPKEAIFAAIVDTEGEA